MHPPAPAGLLPALAAFLLLVGTREAPGVILYRIGTPFTPAEKDSLGSAGIDFREIDWSVSQLQDALEPDSLEAGSLQPNFLDEDEDIAATLLDREGRIWIDVFGAPNALIAQVLVDSDPATDYAWVAVAPESFNANIRRERLTVDLGGRFLIREVHFRPAPEKPQHFLERFTLGIGDREDLFLRSGRVPTFPSMLEVKENTEPEVTLRLDPPVTTSALQVLIFRQTPKEIGLADFEVYGGGFVGRASYQTDVIAMEDAASWGEIRWSGRRDPDARVEIRTRTGSDPQPEVYWEARPEQQDSVRFLQGGGGLTLTEYKRQYGGLTDVLKPELPEDRISHDSDNWSFWSSPYAFDRPGVDIVSPSPRQYFQLAVDFSSTVEHGSRIDNVEFMVSVPPAVYRLLGEVTPAVTGIGEVTRFTYHIRPTIRSGNRGFDGVEISAPSGVASVDSLRMGGVDQPGFSWRMRADGFGFEVDLPRRLQPADSGSVLEVVFSAPVLREVGAVFNGRVFDTARPQEVRQRIVPGNATDAFESDGLAVKTSLSGSLLFSPRVSPNPFTPNADGVNDAVSISYKLLRVTTPVPVEIGIFDLSGALVKRVYESIDPFGAYSHSWDGTGASGRLVPPGVYLYRIAVDFQARRETGGGILAVAY